MPLRRRPNQALQILVALGIGFVEMPGRHMQRSDARLPPASGEVVHIDARAIRGIEKRPQPVGTKWRLETQVRQSLQQVWKALVTVLPRRHRDPQNRARAAAEASHHGGAVPALLGEHFGRSGISNLGSSRPFSQTIGSVGRCTSVCWRPARSPRCAESRTSQRVRTRLRE